MYAYMWYSEVSLRCHFSVSAWDLELVTRQMTGLTGVQHQIFMVLGDETQVLTLACRDFLSLQSTVSWFPWQGFGASMSDPGWSTDSVPGSQCTELGWGGTQASAVRGRVQDSVWATLSQCQAGGCH